MDDSLEQRLLAGYRRQTHLYERALNMLNESAADGWVHDFHALLQDVATLDAGMSADKVAWRQAGQEPGPDLRAVLDTLATQIRTLAEHVEGQVAELLTRKAQLAPAMDDLLRQRSMLNAYGQYRTTTNP